MAYVTTTSASVNLTNGFTKLVSCGGGCGGVGDGSQLSATQALGTDLIAGVKTWNLTISSAQAHGKDLLSIASGATAIIDFFATVTQTSNADTASTMTDNLTGGATAMFTLNNQGDFVWSDFRNTEVTSSGGLTSLQWFNGYLVSGLGLTATTTAVTVGE